MDDLVAVVSTAREQRREVMVRAARCIQEMRDRGLSWRQIQDATDVPWTNARRWVERYASESTPPD